MTELLKIILLLFLIFFGTLRAWATKNFNVKNSTTSYLLVNGTSGNVGVGSVAPGQLLDVQGTARMVGFELTANSSSGYLMVSNSVGVGTWMSPGTLPVVVFFPATANQAAYYTTADSLSGNSNLVFTGSNVGISSVTPGQALDVQGTVRVTGFTLTTSTNAGYVMVGTNVGVGTWMPATTLSVSSVTAGSAGQIQYNNNLAMAGIANSNVTAGGNVGLGTTLSTNKLDIQGTVGIGTSYAGYRTAPSNGLIVQGPVGMGTYAPTGALEIEGGNVGIGTAFTRASALTIMNGNVGIGTWGPTGALQVVGGSVNYFGTNVGIGSFSAGAGLDVNGNIRVFSGPSYIAANVGIYSLAPGVVLDVQGGIRSSQANAGHGACWRADGSLGYCSSAAAGTGTCTCN